MIPKTPGYSLEELEAMACLETALEQRASHLAIQLGRSLREGGSFPGELMQGFREAHADWQASRAVSEVAARRNPDWPLRQQVAAELQRERIEAQHRNWTAQIQAADHSGDRTGDMVRVIARMVADLAMYVDHAAPPEADVDARVALLQPKPK
ncbi:MAG: hypothetical protein AB7O31_05485 [Burkholderiales bacterium]